MLGYIEGGKSEGATVASGGARHGTDGYFIQPTIFTNTRPDMKIVKEEIFGPVGVLLKFKTEEGAVCVLACSWRHAHYVTEAIELANSSEYGLGCGVFTADNARAIRVAHALEAGVAFVCPQPTREPGSVD